jgi:NSS family neurotransmitter:Na+ symporter
MEGEAHNTEGVRAKTVAAHAPRGQFLTRLGVVMATLGSAVGLGNIWKFPSQTGSNGGAIFVVIYLVATLLIGIPVMVAELTMGRTARANAVDTLPKLSHSRLPWWIVGVMGLLSSFIIMAFYTEVAAWVGTYIFKAFSAGNLSTDPAVTTASFTSLISNPVLSLVIQWVDLVLIAFIIMAGVSKGIERVTSRLIPILAVLLVVVSIRSLTLPGAGAGVSYLLKPDITKITAGTLLTAVGLSFFKLSIGMGTMITYGSYYRDDSNIPASAFRVALSDVAIALLAGLAIFPAVFAFGFKPDAGASLLFITIPAVFASMPFGQVFMAIFFLLTFIASIGAQISLFEVTVAFINEKLKLSRQTSTWVTGLGMALVGSGAALSNSSLANFKVLGLTLFDLFDQASSNFLMPIGGLLICIFVGWVWGYENYQKALTNNGSLKNGSVVKVLFFVTKYLSPVLVILVLLNGLKII